MYIVTNKMTQERKLFVKHKLKWIVPKISGLCVIALSVIHERGTLPKNSEDWIMTLVAIGLIFSSHNNPKTNER